MSLPAESTGVETSSTGDAVVVQQQTTHTVDSSSFSDTHSELARTGASSQGADLLVALSAVVVGVVGFIVVQFDLLAVQSLPTVAGVCSLIASGLLAFHFTMIIRDGGVPQSPVSYVPSAGALCVCLGGLIGAIATHGRHGIGISGVHVGGPLLVVGVVMAVYAVVRRRWEEVNVMTSLIPGAPLQTKPIAEGDMFSVSAGDLVPTDGRVSAGSCGVLERYLSPDTHFRVKDEADVIFAGSVVVSGEATVQALTGSYDSCIKRLERALLPGLRWVEESLRRDHEYHVRYYVYLLLFSAVTAAIFWDERGADGSRIAIAGGAILLLSLAGQVGELLYALRARLVRSWAQRGFLLNSPHVWQEFGGIDSVGFDASRLAFETACAVREVQLLDDRISEESLCQCIGSIVGRAEDPALAAVGDYCQRFVGALVTERVVDLREYDGRGISGIVKGIEFSIGTEDFVVERGILIQPSESGVESGENERSILVAIGDDLIARFRVVLGQTDLFSEETIGRWSEGLDCSLVDVTERELGGNVLLVRGEESDAVGRVHAPELTVLRTDPFVVPKSSVVALTPHIESIPMLVKACKRHLNEVGRGRAWVLFGSFVGTCLVFAGATTPVIPVLMVPIVALGTYLHLASR